MGNTPGLNTLQFTFPASISTLNDHGLYQLPEADLGMTMKTTQLHINSTMIIYGTVVRCDDIGEGTLIAHTVTILVVYGKYFYNVTTYNIDIVI